MYNVKSIHIWSDIFACSFVILFILCRATSYVSENFHSQSPPQWTKISVMSGDGDTTTTLFTTIFSQWRILWSCNANANILGSYPLYIDVYDNANDRLLDWGAVAMTCRLGHESGVIYEHGSGSRYLGIISYGPWFIEIDDLE